MSGRSAWVLVGGSAAAAALLLVVYLSLGGASYRPLEVRDPCADRDWPRTRGLEQLAEQFTLSALDGAACELRVTRETLAQAFASREALEVFREEYNVDDARLEDAVRAGLVRAIGEGGEAGAIPRPLVGPLRTVASRLPVDESIAAIRDIRVLLGRLGELVDEGLEGLRGLGGLLGRELGRLRGSEAAEELGEGARRARERAEGLGGRLLDELR